MVGGPPAGALGWRWQVFESWLSVSCDRCHRSNTGRESAKRTGGGVDRGGITTMPSLAKRQCSEQPCPNLAEYRSRCRTHARGEERDRGTANQRGYDAVWECLRRQKLAANPTCQIKTHCEGMFPENAATEVDHIIPIRERPDLRLVWENLQSSCKPCHSAKTARESSNW